ncbi:MAG TPA: DUF305 domain-containing protein [Chloroflexota bacterium]|nr:DUF305 domain-containing protein [Chloroflexota bacterium]HZU07975.1 DUF305 domain-containing protein [Chloroflexota bacterium]
MRRPLLLGAGLALALGLGALLRPLIPAAAQMGPMHPPLEQLSGDAFDRAWLQAMAVHHAMAVLMARPVEASAVHPELRDLARAIIADQSREIAQMRAWLSAWYGVEMPDPVALMDAMAAGQMPMGAMPQDAMEGMPHGMMGGMSPGMMGDMPQGMRGDRQPGPPGEAPQPPAEAALPMLLHHQALAMVGDFAALPASRLEVVFLSLMIPHHQGALDMARLVPDRTAREELQALAADIIRSQSAEIEQMTRWLAEWYGL